MSECGVRSGVEEEGGEGVGGDIGFCEEGGGARGEEERGEGGAAGGREEGGELCVRGEVNAIGGEEGEDAPVSRELRRAWEELVSFAVVGSMERRRDE